MDVNSAEAKKLQEEQMKAAEEQRELFLAQILTPQAKERLGRVALVKAEKAREVENSLIQMAMKRRLSGKVTEELVISMLEKKSEAGTGAVKIVRRQSFDSDDDDLADL